MIHLFMDYEQAASYWEEKDSRSVKMERGALLAVMEEFIAAHNTCALATGCGTFVRCTPIEYSYLNGKFWMLSEGGLKFRALAGNSNVCLAIFDPYSGFGALGGMILPSIINVSETSLKAVPREFEEASLALGATEIETIFRVSVPAARSGIATAIVLGVGRAIGEAMMELLSRIRALLRRTEQEGDEYRCGCLSVDSVRHSVQVEGKGVTLTQKEFEMLFLLMKNRGQVLSREQLIENVWGYAFTGETRTVDVHDSPERTDRDKSNRASDSVNRRERTASGDWLRLAARQRLRFPARKGPAAHRGTIPENTRRLSDPDPEDRSDTDGHVVASAAVKNIDACICNSIIHRHYPLPLQFIMSGQGACPPEERVRYFSHGTGTNPNLCEYAEVNDAMEVVKWQLKFLLTKDTILPVITIPGPPGMGLTSRMSPIRSASIWPRC